MPTGPGPVPGAIYPDIVNVMQTLPDKFTPPPSFGLYPQFSQNGQRSRINAANPVTGLVNPPWEAGPGYTFAGGQSVGIVNANPVVPLPPQPPNTPL